MKRRTPSRLRPDARVRRSAYARLKPEPVERTRSGGRSSKKSAALGGEKREGRSEPSPADRERREDERQHGERRYDSLSS